MPLYLLKIIKNNHLIKRLLITIVLFLPLLSFSQKSVPKLGEKIDFLVSFGIINAGKASMITDTLIYELNGKEVYKVDVFGKSVGIFDFFTRVRDNWGVYVSSSDLNPKKFYRYLEEGKYRKNEILNFRLDSDSVQIEILDKYSKEFIEYKYLHFEDDINKIIRSYFMNYWIASIMYLRSLDYSNIMSRDLVEIPYFDDNAKFSYQMKFLNRENVKISSDN